MAILIFFHFYPLCNLYNLSTCGRFSGRLPDSLVVSPAAQVCWGSGVVCQETKENTQTWPMGGLLRITNKHLIWKQSYVSLIGKGECTECANVVNSNCWQVHM